jgi:lipoprotein-releasing system ATP-binding protein
MNLTKGISVSGLSFGYTAERRLFDDYDTEFKAGEIAAITGASGRGKSTLLYMLGLMLKPNEGSIDFNGLNTATLSDRARSQLRAAHFGFVFQDAALDPSRSVLDNVTETALYRGASLKDARTDAMKLLVKFEVDVDPWRKPGQVSGGQAQRIALCRALLSSPSVLIADEPTGNLDVDSAALVMRAFSAHAEGGGIVIIATHDRAFASTCQKHIDL